VRDKSWLAVGRCVCGKWSYPSRKVAKKVARESLHAHLGAYKCEHSEAGYWHLGHLPSFVAAGRLPRSVARQSTRRNR
jgi:hypothetical protein